MANKLILKQITAVALCKQGCNPVADIVLYKSLDNKGGKNMTFEEILKGLTPEQQEIINKAILDTVTKAKAECGKALEDELDGGVDDALENPDGSLKNPKAKNPKVAKAIEKVAKKVQELMVAKSAPTTSDDDVLKSLPEAVRKMFEQTKNQAAAAEAVAKQLQEEKITKEFVEGAKIYKSIPTSAEDLGSILKDVSTKVSKEACEKLQGILKATNEIIEKGIAFKEMGEKHSGTVVVGKAFDVIQAKAADIQKAMPNMSKEQAFAKVMKDNPNLYEQYLQERNI